MRSAPRTLGLALVVATAATTLAAVELPDFDASYAPLRTASRAHSTSVPGVVASLDQRTGSPTLIWVGPEAANLGRAGDSSEAAARRTVAAFAPAYGLATPALDQILVERVHDTGRGGILVILRQQVDGVPVYGQRLAVLLTRELRPVALGGTLQQAAARGLASRSPLTLAEPDALAVAFSDLHGLELEATEFTPDGDADTFGRRFALTPSGRARADGFVLTAPARAGRTWFPLGDELIAAYQVELLVGHESSTDADAYSWVIAADDGRILRRQNLTADASFNYRVWADPTAPFTPFEGPHEDFSPHPTGVPDGSNPAYTAPSLIAMEGFNTNPFGVADPWLASNAVETRGNNVDAYTDDNAPDGYSNNDLRATTTSTATFDRVYDTSQGPLVSTDQAMAAVTQLFYTTNWLHDSWYDSGFDEAAGNAQLDNYGRGGVGGDPLRAEAQDGALAGARNNANMSTPADGVSPRMQMYLWTGATTASLTLSPGPSPATVGTASFGATSFDVTASVVLVNDGVGVTTDGCEAIVNSVAGSIALIDRGACTFALKVKNAQNAGAVGVVIANNVAGVAPPGLGGADPTITIGTLSITLEDGNALKTSLGGGSVTATMLRATDVERDGDLDGAIVAHEWGHYLHNRLIAGCGTQQCRAQGEGWGDFLAFHTMIRPTDDLAGAYAVGRYGTRGLDDAYFAIRRFPYSTDTTKNDLSFRHISDGEALPATTPINPSSNPNSQVHNAGEIWATMLFEAYGELLGAHGFDEARRRMADYVVTGLQLAPADPTYTEQRDALLAAAYAADPLDADLVAEAFARRGAGACAVSPPRGSTDLVGVVEDFSLIGANLEIGPITLDDSVLSCDDDGYLDGGEQGEIRLVVRNRGFSTVTGLAVDLASSDPSVIFPDGTSAPIPALPPFGAAEIVVRVTSVAAEGAPLSLAEITASIDDSALCASPVSRGASFALNGDLVPSVLETVEAATPTWTESGSIVGVWNRVEDPADPVNHVWLGTDTSFITDVSLVTPGLQVSATDTFVVQLEHRHSFEVSLPTFWDGGVIEVSSDGGVTWQDVTTFGISPGYGGVITAASSNPLADRPAFVATNPAWPSRELVTLDFGTTLAGETVRLRFRIGTDAAAGDFGWEIDDILVSGITNLPFFELGPDTTAPCPAGPGAPTLLTTTPPAGVWAAAPDLEVSWSAPSSAQPISGYSLVIDSVPDTTPDDIVDAAATSFSGAVPGDGTWYAHVRACDTFGDCGPATHAGPFQVDTVAPMAPGAPASPTHGAGPSTLQQIAATWQTSTDALSGVTGYVFRFDGDPSGACEPGATTTATTALSQTFGCGQWYLHVCALDAAGNLSAVATGGPWEIINDFFCDGFESGDTLVWSSTVP